MQILAIDPGPRESAFCLWDGAKIIESGKVEIRLVSVANYKETYVACEHLQCFGMGVGREVFDTAYWIGDFRAQCRQRGILFLPVYRSEVKQHHCHSARATDSNIRYALIDRFGDKGTKKNQGLTYGLKGDTWSAFAIAVMVFDKTKEGKVIEHGKSS